VAPEIPAISLRGVGRDYGDRAALGEVEIELRAGQTLAVLGPNGSGKTTLLRLLAGLLRPSRGSAVVLGCALPGEAWRLRGRVGYLAHAPLLYRDLSARENLRLTARLHGIGADDAERRVERLLESVAIADRGDDRVAELSAGMAQRVAACRAVLHEPELLLLDEPDAHLDAEARSRVGELVGRANGRTRVVVSHDRDRVLADADLALEL
jgi:heme exporter protein A